MKKITIKLIRLYQITLSRVLPPRCRFNPTCSEYMAEAIVKFGMVKGGWLGIRRLARCHPLHEGGYDSVP